MIDCFHAWNFGGASGRVVVDDRLMPEVIRPNQTHSCNVAVIESCGEYPSLNDIDSVICFRTGLKIGVRTADCVPVVIYSPDIRAVAAVHAGWRGTFGGIVTATVKRLIESGADPALMKAAFGPSICGKCYEVSEELYEMFLNVGFAESLPRYRHVDLESVNCSRLVMAGVPECNIIRNRYCTFTTPQLPSWRRMADDRRLLTWISLK